MNIFTVSDCPLYIASINAFDVLLFPDEEETAPPDCCKSILIPNYDSNHINNSKTNKLTDKHHTIDQQISRFLKNKKHTQFIKPIK